MGEELQGAWGGGGQCGRRGGVATEPEETMTREE
jgi:hypothetical protein